MFIVSFYSTTVTILCVISGALVQYFLLATFLIMAGESVNLYMRLVVVLGAKIERYVLKVAIVAWGKLHLAGYVSDSLIYVIPSISIHTFTQYFPSL